MARSHVRAGQGRRRPRGVVIAIVVALFVVLDVALIGFAVMRSDSPSPGATPGPIPTFGSSTPAATNSVPALEPVAVEAQPRFLVVTSASAGWRSTPGSCPGQGAVVESSIDGGATWQQVNPPGVQDVLYLSANASLVTIVARTGGECGLEALKSFTAGQFWSSYPDDLNSSTFPDPTDPTSVQTASGAVSAPCAGVNQVQQRGDALAIACDNQLFESSTAGGDWANVDVPGLLAVTASAEGYTLAVSGDADCTGVSIQTLPAPIGTDAPSVAGCIESDAASAQVSIAQTGSDVWLWSGDRVFTSADSGVSWN